MNKIEKQIKIELSKAVNQAFNHEISIEEILIEIPKDNSYGDYATNLAMQLAKTLKSSPRDIANAIIDNLDQEAAEINSVSIAGPGFINLTMNKASLASVIFKVLAEKDRYGSSEIGNQQKYNLEYVSVNPTGDLHPGHARGAAIGDSVTRLMRFCGYDVTSEYYINDAGNQMILMGRSLQARYFQLWGQNVEVPEDGYLGNDIKEIAKTLKALVGDKYLNVSEEESLTEFIEYGLQEEMAKIRKTLATFRVEFDVFTSERSLYEKKLVEESLKQLADKKMTYQKDGATWLKTTNFNDDKDRVLVKSDGSYTYLTPDIAYHLDKFNRGSEKLVDFLGADHHGYITRLKAAIVAFGRNEDDLAVDIIQMVRMIKDGKEYKLSKRTGQAVSLDDLIEEVGVDALRYLFVAKAADTHMDLDLDLAIKKSNENPVYYAQYAHARLCSILKKADDLVVPDNFDKLTHEKEGELLKQINEFGKVVADAARNRQPHKVCNYMQKLATSFHSFYGKCRCLDEDKDLQNQRLALVKATQITLKNALELIGVEAVERM